MRMVGVLALALAAGVANAAGLWNGQQLAEMCEFDEAVQKGTARGPEIYLGGQCMGFIVGVAEVFNDEMKVIDIPESETYEAIIRVVREYLKEHPDELHESAKLLAFRALVKAYPPAFLKAYPPEPEE